MTLTNITRLRKRIEVIDHEIFYKIVALSNTIKCLEKKTDASISRIQLDISDLEKLAHKKNLDAGAVLKIFNEIMLLVNEKGVELY